LDTIVRSGHGEKPKSPPVTNVFDKL